VQPVDACPICGSASSAPFGTFHDRIFAVPGDYTYRRCRVCRTVYQSPRVVVEDLGLLYPSSYITHAPVTEQVEPPPGQGLRAVRDRIRLDVQAAVTARGGGFTGMMLSRSRFLRERAFLDWGPDELIPRSRPAGRALDVGCGSGLQMRALQRLGWTVEGLEWDAVAAETAAAATGLPVRVGDVHHLGDLGPYDLVLLHHVFEHLHDPVAALASLSTILSPRGRLVLIYPNPGSLARRVHGVHWLAWEAPRHLVIAPPESVSYAAARAGLRVVSHRTTARFALPLFFHSRHGRERGTIDLTDDRSTWADRAWARVERMAVALGAPVGEEAIVALEKDVGH
jgi:2-polyprenyl-3-methyl-5-hydroxy-6-metoxy-1,4-benzoquinol methylase